LADFRFNNYQEMCEAAEYKYCKAGGTFGSTIDTFEEEKRFPLNSNYDFPLLKDLGMKYFNFLF
jgi:hypothetical protein